MRFHVDVNVGDPVWPVPGPVEVPRLLGGSVTLLGYPLTMILAEKIVTGVERGTANTRWRDYADVYLTDTTVPFAGPAVGLRGGPRRGTHRETVGEWTASGRGGGSWCSGRFGGQDRAGPTPGPASQHPPSRVGVGGRSAVKCI